MSVGALWTVLHLTLSFLSFSSLPSQAKSEAPVLILLHMIVYLCDGKKSCLPGSLIFDLENKMLVVETGVYRIFITSPTLLKKSSMAVRKSCRIVCFPNTSLLHEYLYV